MSSFLDLGVPEDLCSALAERGITTPFPIQSAAIPDLLAGRDVCGRAPTGSGKTIAFGAPLVSRVRKAAPKLPRALILAPTRELAAQIQEELKPLAARRGRRVLAIYGGVGYQPQRQALRKGVDILVACPGRLEDLVGQDALRLSEVDIVVIDEADRMADMGFLPAVRRIVKATAASRQTVLFSATLDGDVAVLTRDCQKDPVRHSVENDSDRAGTAEHRFETVPPHARVQRLAEVVGEAGSTIVFCRTRHGADKVAKRLGHEGVRAVAIHGGRSQNQRSRALANFTKGSALVLVATDVAARGIHVDDVACVVHFDLPADAKTYLHRSGRTARKGASGLVVSLVTPHQVGDRRKLEHELGFGSGSAAPSEGRGNRPASGKPRRRDGARHRGAPARTRRSSSGEDRS